MGKITFTGVYAMGKTVWTEEESNFILNNYENMSYKEIGSVLGLCYNSIRHKAKKLGLKKGSGYWSRPPDKYPVHEDYFRTWTEGSAYILGFITADGSISDNGRNRLSVHLNKRDTYILEYVRDKICPTAKIKEYKKTDSNNIKISSNKLILSLKELGLDSKKSGISDIFNIIPKKFKHHFIRGFFDGDGHVSYTNRVRGKYESIEGCVGFSNLDFELLTNIQKELKSGYVRKNRNHFVLGINRFSDIKSFYDFVYKDATIYLIRKHIKFNSFFMEKGLK